jgi:uncharacterized membrane protein YphA (DoxX/SURF4 family)
MKVISAIPRILLGLAFAVLPPLGILHLMPNPPMPEAAVAFAGALMKTGYMMPLIWGTEILCGVLILIGLFVPLALVLLAPVLVNIVAFHVFLAPSGLVMVLVLSALALVVAWQHRRAFDPLFKSAAGN